MRDEGKRVKWQKIFLMFERIIEKCKREGRREREREGKNEKWIEREGGGNQTIWADLRRMEDD